MKRMIVRDAHAQINGDKTTFEMPSGGLEIIASDGRALFSIAFTHDGNGIEINASGDCKHNKIVFGDRLMIMPHARNSVYIYRPDSQREYLR